MAAPEQDGLEQFLDRLALEEDLAELGGQQLRGDAEFAGVNAVYDARALLFGGGEIGPHTLLRFYILHCIFIPLVTTIFLAVHFWRIRRDGLSGPPL